jgi:hypothetical protein
MCFSPTVPYETVWWRAIFFFKLHKKQCQNQVMSNGNTSNQGAEGIRAVDGKERMFYP